MERNYCPYCNHCKMAAEMHAKAEVRKLKELRAKEKAKEEEERQRKEDIRAGKIYGRDFHSYNLSDIENITDSDFLYDMLDDIMPAGQPPTQEEYDELMNFVNGIYARIHVLRK